MMLMLKFLIIAGSVIVSCIDQLQGRTSFEELATVILLALILSEVSTRK